ncbi:MAG: hypothetical protein JST82_03120 [Bacteroidetes bacterium]|nr:hypothetical protein [Bacteroidota bacterium]
MKLSNRIIVFITIISITTFYNNCYGDDTLCYHTIDKNINTIHVQDNYIIHDNIYGKWSIINTKTNEEYTLKQTDTMIQELYKVYYRDSFNNRYPVISAYINATPSLKPVISGVQKWDINTIAIVYSVKDFILQGDDTLLIGRPVIAKYDIVKNKYIGLYTLDSSFKKRHFWYLFIQNQEYFAQGLNSKNRFFLAKLRVNEKEKIFSMKEEKPFHQPDNYKTMSVSPLVEHNITLNNGLAIFDYDDKITRLDNNQLIQIPFGPKVLNKYDYYQIRDVFQDNLYYYVLYLQYKEIVAMRISKRGNSLKNIKLGSIDEIDKYGIGFFNSGNNVILKPLSNNCLIVKSINY